MELKNSEKSNPSIIKKGKLKTTYCLPGCQFTIDCNNLIPISLIQQIIELLPRGLIDYLGEIIKKIKFLVGGRNRHSNQKGFFTSEVYELDFHTMTLNFFLYPIFGYGYHNWISKHYGGLRRYIWESFYHEIIIILIKISQLDMDLTEEAKKHDLNAWDNFSCRFINNLFNIRDSAFSYTEFIRIHNILNRLPVPKDLGFLNILYHRKIKEMRLLNKGIAYSSFERIKLFNELRKLKMNYEYEYNLSELVNYCIHSEHIESFFRGQFLNYAKLHREFYYKAKRIILKFIKEHNIPIKEYKDKANRTHLFLTHEIFERIKSVCLQLCIKKLENSYLREWIKFKNFYYKCPICGDKESNQLVLHDIFFTNKYKRFKEILIEKMNSASSQDELNDLNHFFGVPCVNCFEIVKNIRGNLNNLEKIQKFLIYYGNCPVCGARNHTEYLTSFYYDDERLELKKFLIDYMENENLFDKNVKIGIPCCHCFSKIFPDEDFYYNF
ncbi:MAG: hypothetical protein ACP6IY_05670 [Promethearchaeia archaeon]